MKEDRYLWIPVFGAGLIVAAGILISGCYVAGAVLQWFRYRDEMSTALEIGSLLYVLLGSAGIVMMARCLQTLSETLSEQLTRFIQQAERRKEK